MENIRTEKQLETIVESDDDDIPDIDYTDPVHQTPRPSTQRKFSRPSYDNLIRRDSISRLNEDLFSLVKGERVAVEGFSTDSNSPEYDNNVTKIM